MSTVLSLPVVNQPEAHANVTELGSTEIFERTRLAKAQLGDSLLILGHHYQRDHVLQHADRTGDSYGLSRHAAESGKAKWVVFCGVHFMAETADILTSPDVTVLLPDKRAGCSMADMADIDQVEQCWKEYQAVCDQKLVPITYMNSSAAIKAFTGEQGGAICTSSNALGLMRWAFEQGEKILFLPDQHLGRNTAFFSMGVPLDEIVLWDPHKDLGGNSAEQIRRARILLWKGHCSVHLNFQAEHIKLARQRDPEVRVIVHPECSFEVVDGADFVGSTDYIMRQVEAASPGTSWVIGTENHLVSRLAKEHPEQQIATLSPFACQCSTMYRIDPVDLMRTLEGILQSNLRWPVAVGERTAMRARLALDRMLAHPH